MYNWANVNKAAVVEIAQSILQIAILSVWTSTALLSILCAAEICKVWWNII